MWTIDEMIKSDATTAYATLKNKNGNFLMSSAKKVAIKLKKEDNKFVLDYTAGSVTLNTIDALGGTAVKFESKISLLSTLLLTQS